MLVEDIVSRGARIRVNGKVWARCVSIETKAPQREFRPAPGGDEAGWRCRWLKAKFAYVAIYVHTLPRYHM